MIYTIQILARNRNVLIPFQYYNFDKMISHRIVQNFTHKIMTGEENIISDLVKIYTDYFFEILPYLIVWRSSTQYYINEDLDFYLKKLFNSKKCRFIFLKLTIVSSDQGTHANIVFFDKVTGYMERFEPYGVIPYLEGDKLDELLENKVGGYFQEYLSTKGKRLTYFSPSDFMNGISFQTLSNDAENKVRKLGDPSGFCLAWTFWYIEMRVENPDLNPRDLVTKAVKRINSDNKEKRRDGKYAFIDFIRNYANSLDKLKNELLIESGIDEYYLYNLVLNEKDQEKLMTHLIKTFKRLVNERIE